MVGAEKGFFKKHGLNVTIAKGANWAAIRDSLSNGDNQFTHMLIGMPIASTMGLLGSPKKPMVIPWLVNRNGQAITLKAEWKGKVGADPKALKPFVDKAKSLGEPLSFAMTFPPGTHAMWMRYYLAAGGINPDKDIALNFRVHKHLTLEANYSRFLIGDYVQDSLARVGSQDADYFYVQALLNF